MHDVWVSLSATGLCFGIFFLLGYRVIFKGGKRTPIVCFRFPFYGLNMIRIQSCFSSMPESQAIKFHHVLGSIHSMDVSD